MIPESGSTLELGGPGGAGQTPAYKQLMARKPSAAQPLSARTNIAAFGSGVGQALMGSRMGKVMNAASGGYQDLYRAKAYPDALHKQITGPAPDDPQNEYAMLKKQLMQKRAGMGQVQSTIPEGGSAL